MGIDLRNAAWAVGLANAARAPIPIISVGGLTAGGSGKTPVSAALARHLADTGSSAAVLTAGLDDEATLHSTWNPDIPVLGGRNRLELARQAMDHGATVALLDSGFQHVRLERDLDIVAISADYTGSKLRLPAGPFRERWEAVARADAVILVRRHATSAVVAHLAVAIQQSFPWVEIAEARIISSELRPVSDTAHQVETPSPGVAVAGVMWPESFFVTVKEFGLVPRHCLALPDHAVFDQHMIAKIADLAGSDGVVCTSKDVVKMIDALPDTVPLWHLEERVEWGTGGSRILDYVRQIARLGPNMQVVI